MYNRLILSCQLSIDRTLYHDNDIVSLLLLLRMWTSDFYYTVNEKSSSENLGRKTVESLSYVRRTLSSDRTPASRIWL